MSTRRVDTRVVAAAGLVAGALLVALLPGSALFTAPERLDTAQAGTGERWACPMMDFIGTRPGACPVCGMQMGRVTAGELTLEQQRRMGVQLTTVTEGPARATVRAHGLVRYDDRYLQVVVPRVSGRIVKRHDAARHAGVDVRPGDPIVDLYSPEVFAAQGELAAALRLGDAATIRALTERFARWNLEGVARAIRDGRDPVDTVTITSPLAGRVVLALPVGVDAMGVRLPQVGEEVMADAPLLRLVDPQAFMLVVQVPESRAHWVLPGQPVRLATDDRGELPGLDATLAWVAPELDRDLRSREAHIHVRDPRGLFVPGGLVQARIDVVLGPDLAPADPADPATWGRFTLVPKTAVLSTGVRHVAWRVAARERDGRMRMEPAPLALGPRLEDADGHDLMVVRAGLRPGDAVATQGAFLIDSQAQLAGTASLLFPAGAAAPATGGHVH